MPVEFVFFFRYFLWPRKFVGRDDLCMRMKISCIYEHDILCEIIIKTLAAMN